MIPQKSWIVSLLSIFGAKELERTQNAERFPWPRPVSLNFPGCFRKSKDPVHCQKKNCFDDSRLFNGQFEMLNIQGGS
jgi:hypothetical protein